MLRNRAKIDIFSLPTKKKRIIVSKITKKAPKKGPKRTIVISTFVRISLSCLD